MHKLAQVPQLGRGRCSIQVCVQSLATCPSEQKDVSASYCLCFLIMVRLRAVTIFYRNLLQNMTALLFQPNIRKFIVLSFNKHILCQALLPNIVLRAVNIKLENMVPALKGNHYDYLNKQMLERQGS